MNISRLVKTVFSGGWKGHFGQYAEDVIVRKYFPHNTKVGRYLDIGAHHPFKHSNTAFFWLRGWSGINVDANPLSVELFRRVRKQDVNIHAAVVTEAEMAKGRKNVSLFLPGAVDQEIAISGVGTTKKSHISNDQSYQELLVPACSVKQILVENKVRNFLKVGGLVSHCKFRYTQMVFNSLVPQASPNE